MVRGQPRAHPAPWSMTRADAEVLLALARGFSPEAAAAWARVPVATVKKLLQIPEFVRQLAMCRAEREAERERVIREAVAAMRRARPGRDVR
jgi:hypothetical protein